MKNLRGWTRSAAIGISLLGLMGGVARTQRTGGTGTGQMPQMPPNNLPGSQGLGFPDSHIKLDDPMAPGPVDRQAKMRNDERQKRLVADSDRLLALATDLHQQVEKTDKNMLSLDVIKRADEIEKLAHSVKERMKG